MSHSKTASFLLFHFAIQFCHAQKNLYVNKSRPNVIYILADDLGYGDLSCYGQGKFKTPNIDKLAKEGMLFTQHYSGAPVCAPSRSALLTGLNTGHTYIRGNKEVEPEGQYPIQKVAFTVAELSLLLKSSRTESEVFQFK